MFTEKDVLELIKHFPPTSVTTPRLLRGADGKTLVSHSHAKSRLKSYIERHGRIDERVVAADFDIDAQDAKYLLAWADTDPAFSTPRERRPDISPWVQKIIAIHVFYHARRRPLQFGAVARFFGIEEEIVSRIAAVYARSFYPLTTISGWHLSVKLKSKALEKLRRQSEDVDVENGPRRLLQVGEWPRQVVESLLREVGSGLEESSWELFQKDGWWYIGSPGNSSTHREALAEVIENASHKIDKQGWAFVDHDDPDINNEATKHLGERGLVQLERHADTPEHLWPSTFSLVISAPELAKAITTIGQLAETVARDIWKGTQDRDLSITARGRALYLAGLQSQTAENENDTCTICSLVLYSVEATPDLESLHSAALSDLAGKITQHYLETIRADLQLPFHLYTSALDLMREDQTLHEHQESFLHDHCKTSILGPFFISSATMTESTAPAARTKTIATELAKFRTATDDAKNLSALQTAIKKLVRKLKLPPATTSADWARTNRMAAPATIVESDDRAVSVQDSGPGPAASAAAAAAADADPLRPSTPPGNLDSLRDETVRQKLRTLDRASRGSDVLQQATWILLAAVVEEPALFVAGGRDAGRMIRLYQRLAERRVGGGTEGGTGGGGGGGKEEEAEGRSGMDWVAVGKRLEEYRVALKAGRESEDDAREVKALARKAVECSQALSEGVALS